MESIRRGLRLMKMCWDVLRLDRELIVFPIMSGISAAVIFWIIAVPVFVTSEAFGVSGLDAEVSADAESHAIYVHFAFSFLIYLLMYFNFIFFNAALIACAKIRFAGGDPTVADGIKASVSRLPQIIAWALVAGTVGFILDQISKKEDGIGSIIAGLIGAGWAIATYFAVPVLVSEKVGPIEAIKRSAGVLKKTWGEALVSEVGFAALGFIAVVPAFLLFFVGMLVVDAQEILVGYLLAGAGVIGLVAASLVLTTLGSILKAGLYHYATEGEVPGQFDPDVMVKAFHE